MEDRSNRTTVAMSFIAGGLIGAGIALLFAPQSGKRTRRDISRLGQQLKNRAKALELEVRARAEDFVEAVVDRVQDELERGRESAEEVRQVLKAGKEAVQEQVSKVFHS